MTLPMPTQLNNFVATLIRVHDGDTPILRVQLTPTFYYEGRVRLARCNCPELSTPAGLVARDFAIAWLPLTPNGLIVHSAGYDNYGRLLCEVWDVGTGHNLSDDLIASGNAVVMTMAAQLAPVP